MSAGTPSADVRPAQSRITGRRPAWDGVLVAIVAAGLLSVLVLMLLAGASTRTDDALIPLPAHEPVRDSPHPDEPWI